MRLGKKIALLGIPLEDGNSKKGCLMGPAALRTAGLCERLQELGYRVHDHGDLHPETIEFEPPRPDHTNNFNKIANWTRAIENKAYELSQSSFPIFMGGDHALSIGSVAGLARKAHEEDRPLYVLWLDAHPDFNTPSSSLSGNMHGMPVAAFCGAPELSNLFSTPLENPVNPTNVYMLGIRNIDRNERERLKTHNVKVFDMRYLDEHGILAPIKKLIEKVKTDKARLHVSLDVDFLDPAIAPAVGTTVSGGATFREAHLVMELLHESGCVSSLDLVELNPFLDERGKTALLLTNLTASLFGLTIYDKTSST